MSKDILLKESDYLQHWGIGGMKWGIRRYQNEDGTLTEEGRIRYGVGEKEVDSAKRKSDTLENIVKANKILSKNSPVPIVGSALSSILGIPTEMAAKKAKKDYIRKSMKYAKDAMKLEMNGETSKYIDKGKKIFEEAERENTLNKQKEDAELKKMTDAVNTTMKVMGNLKISKFMGNYLDNVVQKGSERAAQKTVDALFNNKKKEEAFMKGMSIDDYTDWFNANKGNMSTKQIREATENFKNIQTINQNLASLAKKEKEANAPRNDTSININIGGSNNKDKDKTKKSSFKEVSYLS